MSGLENLLAGKTLGGRYRIDEVIGLGGFAAVYRAHDLRLGREVAVKVITLNPADAAARDRLRARFEREARAAASLPHHPNVITVHDFGTEPELGFDFLVMELLRGENLAQRLQREGALDGQLALRILRDAAEGVAVGHAAGIIHRDVKPGNIFLAEPHDEDPFRVCVLDFGLARIASDEGELTRTQAGENPLTAAYAAPEQIRGDAALTPAADVFSLGAVGYQLLCGVKPFAPGEGRRARGRDEVRPLHALNPSVGEGVEAVISRAMAQQPEARYPDAGALAEALDQALGGDDRTVLMPAAALGAAAAASSPGAEDATVLHPAPPAPVAPVAAVAAPVSTRVAYTPAPRRGKGMMVGLVLLLLGAVIAAAYAVTNGRGGGGESGGAPPVGIEPVADDTPGGQAPAPPAVTPPAVDGGVPADPGPTPPPAPPPVVPPSFPVDPRTPPIAPAPPSAPVEEPKPVIVLPKAPPRPAPQPAPQPAPEPAPPPAPAPPPPAPPPAPPTPAPRDTIVIPTQPLPAIPPPR